MSLGTHDKGRPWKGYGRDSNGYSYKGKWITGDYDMMDIMAVGGKCAWPKDEKKAEAQYNRFKRFMNKNMNWAGIQHGAQAHWVSVSREHGGKEYSSFSSPELKSAWLRGRKVHPPKVTIAEGRQMYAYDQELTIVAPQGNVMYLDSHKDVKTALICCGCPGDDA